ncbi:protein-tyrosine phosphatase-like protein [Cladochytrium replicatum]|nr:protein-tyrosine phosphatase-like protein [Cladochytrium replicatum]
MSKLQQIILNSVLRQQGRSTDMDQIIADFLWLGSLGAAANADLLNTLGITHVVNICGLGPSSSFFDNANDSSQKSVAVESDDENEPEAGYSRTPDGVQAIALAKSRNIQYLRIQLQDVNNAPIHEYFTNVTAFIDDALSLRLRSGITSLTPIANNAVPLKFEVGLLEDGPRVLVHCHAGVSRSSTLVIAHLMTSRYFGLDLPDALELVQQLRPVVCPNPGFYGKLFQLQKSKWNDDERAQKWELMVRMLRNQIPFTVLKPYL